MENNKQKKNGFKKVVFISFLLIILLVGIFVGYSSAYFVSTVINNPDPSATTVTTGIMALDFTDGPKVELENAVPGQYVTKTFTIKNTGTHDTYYDVFLSELINDFVDKNDLVYTLSSTNGGANVFETVVPSSTSKIVNHKLIEVNTTHTYTLKIEFKETNDDQNDNLNKTFSSVVRVNE